MTKKEFIIDLLPLLIAFVMATYWLATGDKIKSDPYLLGVFRTFIGSTLIMFITKRIVG